MLSIFREIHRVLHFEPHFQRSTQSGWAQFHVSVAPPHPLLPNLQANATAIEQAKMEVEV